ncbi:hypothetical protein BAUCODRAFT_20839 [Baudoinia panamericana UAMH 10762]|uniref:Uncharacterized protein n=1 Tax=Baudoinia panamericana (strain UAMH 10762) TaxID=717646 RepID=M2NNK3_BAUPA|nr:uncharacterized protein BAUCODRAFT_20839 [Baudoinia panamericana UAMH 10762]EMD00816.1 hypothetical protein BAUCODRAFT_20839 [Baudoinia panamericana UAMH 10762]
MDNWQATQNWLIFGAIAVPASVYYAWPYIKNHMSPPAPALTHKHSELASHVRNGVGNRKAESSGTKGAQTPTQSAGAATSRKRKAPREHQPETVEQPTVAAQSSADDYKEDNSNRQFAERMLQARKGADLSRPKNQEQRTRTVKPSRTVDTPVISAAASQTDADADDDMSPAASPALRAGDVSDMLEPARKGPSTLRLTAPTQPQKQRVVKLAKEEVEETKRQRQNRLKKEQARLEREAQEAERKGLEEKQRRAAREARGEPAKNGISVSKPPATNAWNAKPTSSGLGNAAPVVNGHANGMLLDTFDAESTASSTGGMEASTAATSTTTEAEPGTRDHDQLSEEEQMAMALKQSEADSGWSVALPKKQQKRKGSVAGSTGTSTPMESNGPVKPASKPAKNGKGNGFMALNVEHITDPSATITTSWDP